MTLAELKALQQTAAAAVADLGTGVDQLLDDTGTEIRKLVMSLVHDVDRVTYQRDVAERAVRELRKRNDTNPLLGALLVLPSEGIEAGIAKAHALLKENGALKARIAELMDLVDEAGREAANIDTSLSDPQAGKLLVVRIDDGDAERIRLKFQTGSFRADQFVGWLEGPRDEGDTETKPHDVSHAGLPTPVIERCSDCSAVAGRGHLSDCAVAAIVGGAA